MEFICAFLEVGMGLLRRQFTSHPPLPAGRLWLALAITLVLLGTFAAGCSLFRPAVDPYAELRQSWRPGYELTDAQLEALPAYSITVRIDPTSKEKVFSGALDLTLPITGAAPLRELYFRTYPNLYAFGGNLQVTGARVNGTTVNFGQAAEGSAVHLSLPTPLQPGSRANVWLSFTGNAARESQPGVYTIFGANEDVLNLTNFYPILAARRGDEWALDIPHPQGDVGFHDAARYRAAVTAPADQVVVATGAEITRTVDADGWATTRYVLGPAREFTVLLSPSFQMTETETLGTRIRSYFYPKDAAAARTALYAAAAALQVYTDQFGAYPYRDMAIVEAPMAFHGMEFPGLSLIGSQVYDLYRKDLETLVVHEVAHQWWYNQVGSDQVLNPWLDEGLAEFSMYDYFAGRYGEPRAQQLRELRWQIPVDSLRKRGKDAPIGLPVRDYKENYETLVYGKGAEFFATLRDELGPPTFQRLLRTYLERFQWRIVTPAEFRALAEEVSGKDLGALFGEWVEGTD
jgi:hypothetical protein